MIECSLLPRYAIAAIALTLTVSTSVYAQDEQPFVPQVGQAGKDVVWVPTPPESPVTSSHNRLRLRATCPRRVRPVRSGVLPPVQ